MVKTSQENARKLPRISMLAYGMISVALLLLILGGCYVVYAHLERYELRKNKQNLSAVAGVKTEQIKDWIRQNVDYAAAAGNGSYLASCFGDWVEGRAVSPQKMTWMRYRLASLRKSQAYGDLALYDLNGKLYLSTEADPHEVDGSMAGLVDRVVKSKAPAVGQMRWHEKPGGIKRASLSVAAPLMPSGSDGPVVGILVFELNPQQHILPLIETWPTSSKSAEVMLLAIEGDEVVFLNALRHQKDGMLSRLNVTTQPASIAAQAVKMQAGWVQGTDYRGMAAMGYAMRIPDMNWTLVVEIAKEEIDAPLRRLAAKVATVALILAVGGGIFLWLERRRRKAQYEQEKISEGLQREVLTRQVDFLSKYANDAMLLIDEAGAIVELNDRAESMYGYSRQQLMGMNLVALRAPDEAFDSVQFKQSLLEKKSLLVESNHQRRDGTVFPVEVSVGLIESDTGGFAQCIVRDISERRQSESALRLSESRLSLLFNNMSNGFALHEVIRNANGQIVDCRYLEVNPAFEKITGKRREELVGKCMNEVFPPLDAHWLEDYARVVETGEPMHKEGFVALIKGWYSVYAFRSAPEQFASMVEDITTRKLAEQRAQRLMNLYHALSETNDAIVRLKDQTSLFPLACRIAVELGGMMLAWVGMPDQKGENLVLAHSYGDLAEYLDGLTVSLSPDASGKRWPTATTFCEMRVVVVNDFDMENRTSPWYELARQYGIQASASFPILRSGAPYAVFTVYSDQKEAFDDEFVRLLNEISANLSFALDNFEREAARRQAEKDLRLAATVFENSHSAIVITDDRANIIAVNPAFTHVTGYAEEEVQGRNPRLLKSGRQGGEFYQGFWSALEQHDCWQGEMWNCRKNGEEYAAWLSVSVMRDENGLVRHYIGVADDITESKEIRNQMEYLAYHDSLTGLPNRVLANDRLEHAIAQAARSKSRVAVLFLDLDDFKSINDTLGHSVGDSMLKAVGERLQQCVRGSDTVSRLGGDEFLVMLNDVTEIEAINRVAANLLEEIGKTYHIDSHSLSTSTSIGIAVYPDDGKDRDTLLKNADMAMYNAKQSGRNTHRFFTEEMNDYVLEHLLIRNGLSRAIENNEFELHYQPLLDLETGKVLGAEALIRWRHPDLGMIPPNRFIQVAEDSGMIVPIGNWVLREACRQTVQWHQAGYPDLIVAVNISAVQFRRGDLEQVVSDALKVSGLQPKYLELELTESILIQDIDKTLEVLQRLGQLGVHLSIDDFGTGYSSLSYLRRLPVNKLKIDRSFVREITLREDDAAIALSIITLSHSLRKRVVAEGVETAEQLRFLRMHSCDEIQGYLFSRPLTAEAFGAFLQRGMGPDFLHSMM